MAEYIDRQAVLDELDEDIEEFVECDYALKTAKKYIKKIPPADVRPVLRGRWKITSIYIKCLECGECFMLIPQNFCPNCGADMRGEG